MRSRSHGHKTCSAKRDGNRRREGRELNIGTRLKHGREGRSPLATRCNKAIGISTVSGFFRDVDKAIYEPSENRGWRSVEVGAREGLRLANTRGGRDGWQPRMVPDRGSGRDLEAASFPAVPLRHYDRCPHGAACRRTWVSLGSFAALLGWTTDLPTVTLGRGRE